MKNNKFKYVNWYDKKEVYDKPINAIIWKDVVTHTVYYIEKEKAAQISSKGISYINSIDNIEELYKYMSGEIIKEDKDLSVFPQMPYIKEKNDEVIAYRISDHVIVRTGILYSLFGEDENIRRYGLTEGINIFCDKNVVMNYEIGKKVKEVAELIDKVLIGKVVEEEKCKNLRFDIVKGGTVKVKQYYLETNKIKDIRGASRILYDLNRKIIPDYIKENYIGECIVYSGGGNILGVFPEGKGKEISRIIEAEHEKESITAQSSASYISCTLFDLSVNKYKRTMAELQFNVVHRQMSKFNFNKGSQINNVNFNKYKKLNGEDICSHCNIRRAFYEVQEEKLCDSCLNKSIKGGLESKNDFKEQYRKFCSSNGIELDKPVNVNSLKDIGGLNSKGEFIGVIYGDGNNMGSIVQNIENLGQMRYFSSKTENTVFEAVYSALGNILHHDGFEIIAIGGDDIFMIVPADKALEIGIQLGKKFDDLFKNKSKEEYKITMSLGIAISHCNTPVQYLFDLSQQLLKNAKKKSKNKDGLGTVDIMILETESGVGASLKAVRKSMKNNNINLTLRPYTWSEASAVTDSVKELKKVKARTKAYDFRDVSYDMEKEEGELYYLYQMKRLEDLEKNKKEKTTFAIKLSLKNLAEAFDLKENALNLSSKNDKDKAVYSPWNDIVELWDYSEGEGKVKNFE